MAPAPLQRVHPSRVWAEAAAGAVCVEQQAGSIPPWHMDLQAFKANRPLLEKLSREFEVLKASGGGRGLLGARLPTHHHPALSALVERHARKPCLQPTSTMRPG